MRKLHKVVKLRASFIKRPVHLFFIFCCVLGQGVIAQEGGSKSKYRVIAVQNGGSHIKSVSNEVIAIVASKYYFPNAFSPNGDGLNDTFGVIGSGIGEYELLVFNRTGELLFVSTNPNMAWDGTYMNNKVPAGTYVYKVKIKGKRSGGEFDSFSSKAGTVTIVN